MDGGDEAVTETVGKGSWRNEGGMACAAGRMRRVEMERMTRAMGRRM